MAKLRAAGRSAVTDFITSFVTRSCLIKGIRFDVQDISASDGSHCR
jgi:hypothetical protein